MDIFSKQVFDITIEEAHNKQICIKCKRDAKAFRDEKSEKEYKISGFCQICQDITFEGVKEKEWLDVEKYPPVDNERYIVYDEANGIWTDGVWLAQSKRFIKIVHGARDKFVKEIKYYMNGPKSPYKENRNASVFREIKR